MHTRFTIPERLKDLRVAEKKDSSQGRRLTSLVLVGILLITTRDAEMWY